MRKKQIKKQCEEVSPIITAIFTEPPYPKCARSVAKALQTYTFERQAVDKAPELGGTHLRIAYSRYFGETLGPKGMLEE